MASRHRKLRVQAELACVDLSTLLEPPRAKTPNLLHFAVSYKDDKMCSYVQCKTFVSPDKLSSVWKDVDIDITDISPYCKVEGKLQDEWGAKPVGVK